MDAPFGPMRVIVNPHAGKGAVEVAWPAVRAVLEDAGVPHDAVITEGPGHAIRAAREAIEKGIRFVVAVGGDGTIHEVVNGLMGDDGPLAPDIVLGLVPAGSGSDTCRTFGLPRDPADAARHLLGDSLWGRMDIGRVTCGAPGGGTLTRWFPNIAEAGLGASVVDLVSRMPKWLGGSMYRIASLRGLATYRPLPARVAVHGRMARGVLPNIPFREIVYEADLMMLVVANCQFFGGGMHVAPRAIPSDGLLDIQIARGSAADAMKSFPKMLRGEHVPDPNIKELLATSVVLEADPRMLVEADGEVLGTAPARFDLVPGALQLKV